MYALEIIPYDGLGCQDTLYTTVHLSPDPFVLKVIPDVEGCAPGVDITKPFITAGSTPNMTYTYYLDATGDTYLPTPKEVTVSGTYYIRGTNLVGCSEIKPINVTVLPSPVLIINQPEGVCQPNIIDITLPPVTTGSEPNLMYTYWKDEQAIIPLPNPANITTSGTYYIKTLGTVNACTTIKPVMVKIGPIPNVVISNPSACGQVDITSPKIVAGSTPGLTYLYFSDAAGLIPLPQPTKLVPLI